MTETITFAETPKDAPPDSVRPILPADVFMNLIAAFLAPMFLSASGGDIALARMAAVETLNAYRARHHVDLIAIAQVTACGLAALASLSLSMADHLSLSMTLRLRSNAVALNRSAEQHRRALSDTRSADHPYGTDGAGIAFTAAPDEALAAEARYEAEVVPNMAAAPKRTAQTQARPQNVEPAARQAPIPAFRPIAVAASTVPLAAAGSPSVTTPAITDQQWRAMWASAMTDVAGEFAADLKNLPPAERRLASRRAAALSSCANQLITGDVPPRPAVGDQAAIKRPASA